MQCNYTFSRVKSRQITVASFSLHRGGNAKIGCSPFMPTHRPASVRFALSHEDATDSIKHKVVPLPPFTAMKCSKAFIMMSPFQNRQSLISER